LNAAHESTSSTPLQNLLRSRERLRAALAAAAEPRGPLAEGDKSGWQASLNAAPGARIIMDVLKSWWSQHPLRVAALIGEEAGNALIKPTAQKYPLLLVTGALILGAAFVRVKPWRWGFKKVLLAGLLPQLVSKVVSELPVSSWMAMASELIKERQPRTDDKKTEPAPSADH
jgi:hypothetical protein